MRERVTARPSSLPGPAEGISLFARPSFWVRALGVLALAAVLCGLPGPAFAKYAAFVFDTQTGKVLYADHADDQNHPASLTKMMTLYLLFEDIEAGKLNMRTLLKVSPRAERQPPTSLGLRHGETIPVQTAIEAIIIKSANDVAVTVAENLAPSEPEFAKRMTRKAHELGMSRTTFRNASGLHHREQVTTARDLARLAFALQHDFPKYYKYFNLREFDYAGLTIPTHNNLLKFYPGADGLKTGFIQASGFNLAASAVRNGHRLIAVVMGGNTARWRDQRTADLLDRGFQDVAMASNRVPRPPMNPETQVAVAKTKAVAAPRAAAPAAPKAETSVASIDAGIGEGDVDPAAATLPPPEPEAVAEPKATFTAASRQAPRAANIWGIQVGAYSDRNAAEKAANVALSVQSDAAANGAVTRVEAVKAQRKTLYRARVVGLAVADAQRACSLLKRDSRPCMVVKPSELR